MSDVVPRGLVVLTSLYGRFTKTVRVGGAPGARCESCYNAPRMRINVPHHTDKDTARKKINERIAMLFSQYGHYLSDSEHKWDGDNLYFSGSAKGFKVNGTVQVTDSEVIIDGKLPLMAKPFEPRVKSAIEKEAAAMFA